MDKTISLSEWVNADIDKRSEYLIDGYELDEDSRRLLSWYLLFKDQGAIIDNDVLLRTFAFWKYQKSILKTDFIMDTSII